jgi:hypothetical protein
VIELTNVDTAYIHSCWARSETEIFLSVAGEASQAIALRGNHLAEVKRPVVLAPGVSPDALSENEWAQRIEQGV